MPDTLITEARAPRFGHEGTRVVGYASPSRGSRSVSAWRVVLEPGAGSPLHQVSRDEAFVAIRGEARVELGGEQFTLRAGDGLSVPPHTAFRIINEGTGEFEAVVSMAADGTAWLEGGEPFTPPWAV